MINYRNIPLGAKPDRHDRRDKYKSDRYKYKLSGPPPLPEAFTLPYLPPIKDQGQTSSCTGHAACYFWEAINVSRGVPYIQFSPMYTWYYARLEEGCQDKDEGVQMRTIMAALNKHGTCPENVWPHNSPVDVEPDSQAQLFSASRLPTYERCDTLQSIKYALAVEIQPVCLGLDVYDCWYDKSVNETGIIPFQTTQISIGGHAVTCCGYNDAEQLLLIANSWGTDYGNKGFIQVPYAYLEKDWWDAWTAGFDTIPNAI